MVQLTEDSIFALISLIISDPLPTPFPYNFSFCDSQPLKSDFNLNQILNNYPQILLFLSNKGNEFAQGVFLNFSAD